MKIKCQYCGNMMEDTLDKCPYCSAPNVNVVRATKDQPQTIEELAQWYQERSLPPYETTRFFIGIDYKEPRAFGIYKDEQGNFVVYKNKDTGARAIRYKGTDEAYAVNELFMRLKQEIIEQKRHNIDKNSEAVGNGISAANSVAKEKKSFGSKIGRILKAILIFIAFNFGAIGIFAVIGDFLPGGYYRYENTPYYCVTGDSLWFTLDQNGEWSGVPLSEDSVPDKLKNLLSSKKYYLSYDWDSSLGVPDFDESAYMKNSRNPAEQGYYHYGDSNYYNLTGDYYNGWYIFDDGDWSSVDSVSLPEELKSCDTAHDFFYTPTWDPATQVTDFEDSQAYEDYQEQLSNSESSSDYDWSSSDSWDSGSTDFSSDW